MSKVSAFKGRLEEMFEQKYSITVEEFGKTACDYHNEYYVTVCFEQGDVNMEDELWESDNYSKHTKYITETIEKILDEDQFGKYSDYSSTLECVTYGNNTMIAMVLFCK